MTKVKFRRIIKKASIFMEFQNHSKGNSIYYGLIMSEFAENGHVNVDLAELFHYLMGMDLTNGSTTRVEVLEYFQEVVEELGWYKQL